jgi:hypothetical protein
MGEHERSQPRREQSQPRRERMSTVNIYASDLARLQAHQRRISEQKTEQFGTRIWLTMAEIVRGMLNAAEAKAETGE